MEGFQAKQQKPKKRSPMRKLMIFLLIVAIVYAIWYFYNKSSGKPAEPANLRMFYF